MMAYDQIAADALNENQRLRTLLEQAAAYIDELVRPPAEPSELQVFWARGVELEARIRTELRS
jgi:hypothetical protein